MVREKIFNVKYSLLILLLVKCASENPDLFALASVVFDGILEQIGERGSDRAKAPLAIIAAAAETLSLAPENIGGELLPFIDLLKKI